MLRQALPYAVPIWSFVIGLFYYWFGVANRYIIFLYYHLDAGPFDSRTVTRYWMSGLVASGAVMVLYAMANWFGGRVAGIFYRRHVPPTLVAGMAALRSLPGHGHPPCHHEAE